MEGTSLASQPAFRALLRAPCRWPGSALAGTGDAGEGRLGSAGIGVTVWVLGGQEGRPGQPPTSLLPGVRVARQMELLVLSWRYSARETPRFPDTDLPPEPLGHFVLGHLREQKLSRGSSTLIATRKCSLRGPTFLTLPVLSGAGGTTTKTNHFLRATFASFSGTLKKLWIKFLVWLKASK